MATELPVQTIVFDLLYLNGKSLVSEPLEKRCATLRKILKEIPQKITYVDQIIASKASEVEKFYRKSLGAGNEGVMMKNVESEYSPNARVGHGVKIKPTMEPLDLVILGGEWGTGRRAGWISSFVLGCRDDGEFLRIGKVGTGFKEKTELGVSFEELTKMMKKDIIESAGREIVVRPKIVIEVGYEEIQKSPTYESGYALRFPRLLRLRDDKPISEVDDLKRVEKLYGAQRGQS